MSGAVVAKKLQDEKVYRGSGLNALMGIGVTPSSLVSCSCLRAPTKSNWQNATAKCQLSSVSLAFPTIAFGALVVRLGLTLHRLHRQYSFFLIFLILCVPDKMA